MIKIAFASCFCTRVFDDQPVWDWIKAHSPDYLVLLGDSIYMDINFKGQHPMDMLDDAFAKHLHTLYSELLSNTQFNQLIRSMPNNTVFSIWDDHDFLWNDMNGADAMASPDHRSKLPITSSFYKAFRNALSQSLQPGSFPAAYNDAALWQPNAVPLATPSINLPHNTFLHLTDGRTFRTRKWGVEESKRTILGDAQKARVKQIYTQSPIDSVHLFASGSIGQDYRKSYYRDWTWMTDIASKRRTLILSGDIHRNELSGFENAKFPIHEATSSGAGVRDLVVAGKRRRNYGMLEIDDAAVNVFLYADNSVELSKRRLISRTNWLPT